MDHACFRGAQRACRWCACLTVVTSTIVAKPGVAFAQTATSADFESAQGVPEFKGFHWQRDPGWSLGLESYAGLAVVTSADGARGHGIAGGLSRFQTGYLEFGAGLEVSDLAITSWRQVGAFVGAYLPVAGWVDFDTTIGLAQRNYLSPDTRYGPGGIDVRGPALTYRIGFSDRPIDDTFGLRLGAAMLFSVDLKHHDAEWTYDLGPQGGVASGVTRLGGVSVGLVACLGFDVAFNKPHARLAQ